MIVNEKNRIVVSGMGIVSPFGIGAEVFAKGLEKGNSAVKVLDRFEIRPWCGARLAGCVPEFSLEELTGNPKESKRASPMFKLAWSATHLAIQDSGLELGDDQSERTGIFMGSSRFLLEQLEHYLSSIFSGRLHEILPLRVEQSHPHGPAVHLSYLYRLFGPTLTFSGCCQSGIQALESALVFLLNGITDIAIVVSADVLSPFQFHSEASSGILSHDHRPGSSPRPFDQNANGCVLSEGAVALVIEREKDCMDRGMKPHARINAIESLAAHVPFPPGNSEPVDMDMALNAILKFTNGAEIDLVHVQGRGIKALDVSESRSLRKAFTSSIERIPVTSIEGSIGHAGGTSAFFQIASAVLSMERSIIPPIVNLQNVADGCDLNFVTDNVIRTDVDQAVVFSPGWGGQHSAVLLTK